MEKYLMETADNAVGLDILISDKIGIKTKILLKYNILKWQIDLTG
jgi:hypothetical protein